MEQPDKKGKNRKGKEQDIQCYQVKMWLLWKIQQVKVKIGWWQRYPDVYLRFSKLWFCAVQKTLISSLHINLRNKWWVLKEFNYHSMCLGAVVFAVVRKTRCVSSFLMECFWNSLKNHQDYRKCNFKCFLLFLTLQNV